MMKRILYVGTSLGSGGAEHQVSILMNTLVERGYNVTIATYVDIPDHYEISPLINRVRIAPHKRNILKLLALEKYLLTTQVDVVFAFSHRDSVSVLLPMLIRRKVKVICGERNFTIGKPSLVENILHTTGLYRRANYIVPNNYSQGRLLSKNQHISEKIRVITNYTDVETYNVSPIPHNEIRKIGIFGRCEEQKNLHRFIEALNILNQQGYTNYHIDWYGNHKFKNIKQISYFAEAKRMVDTYKLESYITFHDPIPNVSAIIPTFDIMCLPSLYEGFSNSISEYICCGRPVICSDVSDNSLMVHDGENGYLFNPLSVNSIVDSFLRYFNSDNILIDYMGKKSREIALSLFDKNRFIESYIKLIES